MTIIFEPYDVPGGDGATTLPLGARGTDRTGSYGDIQLLLQGGGSGTGIGAGVGATAMPMGLFGANAGSFGRAVMPLGVFGYSTAVAKPAFGIGSVPMALHVAGHGFATQHGSGDMPMPLGMFGSDAANFGRTSMPLGAYGRDVAPSRFANLYQFPWVEINVSTGSTLALSDGFQMRATEEADFVMALVDLIQFDARYSVSAVVVAALQDGMTFTEIAQMFLWADLVDGFIASEVLGGTAQITVMLADGFGAGDAADGLATILAALRDGFYASLTIAAGDDEYTAWVMTTQTRAMRSYSNYPFNSFAVMDGTLLAAGKEGIYRMGGSTDAGAQIRSAIRTGLLNFGTMAMKSAPIVYIGATAFGELLLRVQATTTKGEDLQQTYRMVPGVTGAPREHRVAVGKGFRSVYWTFELANDVDGAAFEVHEWHLLPTQHTGKLI